MNSEWYVSKDRDGVVLRLGYMRYLRIQPAGIAMPCKQCDSRVTSLFILQYFTQDPRDLYLSHQAHAHYMCGSCVQSMVPPRHQSKVLPNRDPATMGRLSIAETSGQLTLRPDVAEPIRPPSPSLMDALRAFWRRIWK